MEGEEEGCGWAALDYWESDSLCAHMENTYSLQVLFALQALLADSDCWESDSLCAHMENT